MNSRTKITSSLSSGTIFVLDFLYVLYVLKKRHEKFLFLDTPENHHIAGGNLNILENFPSCSNSVPK